ncbi:hypothetical protein M3M35_01925 [Fructilactobacillus myrtifloralis]|uniref:Uncharacterized protein n=1 Tax=Fructilactobacillus myrtifloralis TaxID=2940301 RepID=A0ABY5BQX4_9LACO|nr:hypothetical protein [Fructilactobacillus myrtifloralis]USS85447.1 hypothetical protein M3M35_01925 [Fructilactobacillus myrtifloralis]
MKRLCEITVALSGLLLGIGYFESGKLRLGLWLLGLLVGLQGLLIVVVVLLRQRKAQRHPEKDDDQRHED